MPHCFCVRQPGKRKLSAQFIEQNRNDWRHRGEVGWRVRGRDIFPYFTKISENILNREIFVWGRGVFFYTICLLIPGRILFRSYKNMCLLILYKAICQVLTSC